jgi:hypothetical protein
MGVSFNLLQKRKGIYLNNKTEASNGLSKAKKLIADSYFRFFGNKYENRLLGNFTDSLSVSIHRSIA